MQKNHWIPTEWSAKIIELGKMFDKVQASCYIVQAAKQKQSTSHLPAIARMVVVFYQIMIYDG